MPIGNGFFCFCVHFYSADLPKRDTHFAALPFDLDENFMRAVVFIAHIGNFHALAFL